MWDLFLLILFVEFYRYYIKYKSNWESLKTHHGGYYLPHKKIAEISKDMNWLIVEIKKWIGGMGVGWYGFR